MTYRYKALPAPTRPAKIKGLKSADAQFAAAIEAAINEQAADGWRYLRTDTVPCEARQGLTGKTTVFRSVMVFEQGGPAPAAPMPQDDTAAGPARAPAPVPPAKNAATPDDPATD